MGDVGHQVAAEAVLSVEMIGHPVEGLGEGAQLAGPVGVDAGLAPPGGEVTCGNGERCDGTGDAHRDVESNDEGHCPGNEHSEECGAGECVADVAFGFHCLGGEPQRHRADGLAVDDDRGRHRVATGGVHGGHAVHLHHHRGQRVGRRSDHLTIRVDDGQRCLASRCNRRCARQVGCGPTVRPLIRLARCDRGCREVVLALTVGEPGDLVACRHHRQRSEHPDCRQGDREECQRQSDTQRPQQRTTGHESAAIPWQAEPISDTEHCLDHRRIVGIRFDLAA